MLRHIKKMDAFSRNVILVFAGTSFINAFNLLYQLLIAHRLSPADFAAFNALLSIFMVLATPLSTLQTAVVKYASEFHAHGQTDKIKSLFAVLLKRTALFAVLTCFIVYSASFYIIDKLKIPSVYSAYILILMLALSWFNPVLLGGLQGLHLFKWFVAVSVIAGAVKLIFGFIFIRMGFSITGALGAFLVAVFTALVISGFALRRFFYFAADPPGIDLRGLLLYMLPVALGTFCFTAITNMDMVLVRYYFAPAASGIYAVAQMAGKIFIFLPGAISIVLFPKTSGLSTKQNDTTAILKRSLAYAAALCILAIVAYNFVPAFVLKILTGKAPQESILLGRFFSVSMSFYALLFILITYFLSIRDLRFIKYLVIFTIIEALAIVFWHGNLVQVQWVFSFTGFLLFVIHWLLAKNKKR